MPAAVDLMSANPPHFSVADSAQLTASLAATYEKIADYIYAINRDVVDHTGFAFFCDDCGRYIDIVDEDEHVWEGVIGWKGLPAKPVFSGEIEVSAVGE
jgi:tRNA1(Val) A37 N6-methylase TrmN6